LPLRKIHLSRFRSPLLEEFSPHFSHEFKEIQRSMLSCDNVDGALLCTAATLAARTLAT
jgi:hypothetical protein